MNDGFEKPLGDTQPTRAPAVTLKDVFAARKAKDFQTAYDLVRQLQAGMADPDPSLSMLKAQILRNMQCFTDAAVILHKLHNADPDDTKTRLVLADTLRALGDVKAGLELVKGVVGLEAEAMHTRLLLAHNMLAEAMDRSTTLLDVAPNAPAIIVLHCEALVRDLQWNRAAAVLDNAMERGISDRGVLRARVDLALRQDDLVTARMLLDDAPDTPDLLALRQRFADRDATSQMSMQDRIDAQIAQLRGGADDADLSLAVHLDLGDLLFLKGDWRGALRHFRLSGANSGANRARTMKVARCHHRLLYFGTCRKVLERLLNKNPQFADALLLRSNIDLVEGRVEASIATLRDLAAMPGIRQSFFRLRLYRAYMRQGDLNEANSVRAALVQGVQTVFDPDVIDMLVQFNGVQEAFDLCAPWSVRAAQNKAYVPVFQAVEAASGASFDQTWAQPVAPVASVDSKTRKVWLQNLRQLGRQADRTAQHLPVHTATNAAWRVTDHSALTFDTWQRLARHATENIRQLSLLGVTHDEIADIADFPTRDALGRYADTDQPLILVASHTGPPVVCALDKTLLAGRPLAYLRTQAVEDRQKDRLIAVGTAPEKAAIALVKALGAGKTLSLALDSPVFWQSGGRYDTGARGTIFGVPVTISATAVKLSQSMGAPIFWVQPMWKNGRIVYECEEMGVVPKDMPFQQAADLWAQDYLARVEAVMRSGPENLDLSAPMWQHVVSHGLGAPR